MHIPSLNCTFVRTPEATDSARSCSALRLRPAGTSYPFLTFGMGCCPAFTFRCIFGSFQSPMRRCIHAPISSSLRVAKKSCSCWAVLYWSMSGTPSSVVVAGMLTTFRFFSWKDRKTWYIIDALMALPIIFVRVSVGKPNGCCG